MTTPAEDMASYGTTDDDRAAAGMTPQRYATVAADIEAQIATVIVGQRALVREVLTCLLCEGHALLEGVPGLGKTQLLKTLSLGGGAGLLPGPVHPPTSCPPTSSAPRCSPTTARAIASSGSVPGRCSPTSSWPTR